MSGRLIKVLSTLIVLLATPSVSCAGTVLITEREARLPQEHLEASPRAITRGPRIELIQPSETAYSPMHFQLKFQSFGGSSINTESLRVIYLKTPEIDITPRVARFVRPAGIDIPDAEAPVGEHHIRVDVTDSEGRTRSTVFTLKIAP
jgi:hypothetical protein